MRCATSLSPNFLSMMTLPRRLVLLSVGSRSPPPVLCCSGCPTRWWGLSVPCGSDRASFIGAFRANANDASSSSNAAVRCCGRPRPTSRSPRRLLRAWLGTRRFPQPRCLALICDAHRLLLTSLDTSRRAVRQRDLWGEPSAERGNYMVLSDDTVRLKHPCRARFWVPVNGDLVKLSLRPGLELEHYFWRRTDEGFEARWVCWTHDGVRIVREWSNTSRDCDGYLRRRGTEACELDEVAAVRSLLDADVWLPRWRPVQESQRCSSAEEMRY